MLAFDRDVGWWGVVTTVEVVVAKNVRDVAYSNLNYVVSRQLPDARPTYAKKNTQLNDVILLANTSKGGQWSISVKGERPLRNGFYSAASYLYGRATSVNDGTSNIAASGWANAFIGGDINDPPLARSVYDEAAAYMSW